MTGRTRWVVLAAVAVLVVLVLAVRPDVSAELDARPEPSLPSLPSPPAEPDRPVLVEELVDPAVLRTVPASRLPVSPSGIGDLRLGQAVTELMAAGWPLPWPDASATCARLPSVPVADGAITGWADDGVVVSLQLELSGDPGEVTETGLGVALGAPLPDHGASSSPTGASGLGAAGPLTSTVTDAEGRAVVTRVEGDSQVSASTLGQDDVRYVEVATADGAACTLSGDTVRDPAVRHPTEAWVASVAGEATTGRPDRALAGRHASLLGAPVAELSGDGWDGAAEADPGSCTVARRTFDGDQVTLWLEGGVVTAERFDAGDAGPAPDGLLQPLASGGSGRSTQTEVTAETEGTSTRMQYALRVDSVLVEAADSFAVTDVTVVWQSRGEPCA